MRGRLLFQAILAAVLVVAGSIGFGSSLLSVAYVSHDGAVFATVVATHAVDVVLGIGLGLGIATIMEARSRARAMR